VFLIYAIIIGIFCAFYDIIAKENRREFSRIFN